MPNQFAHFEIDVRNINPSTAEALLTIFTAIAGNVAGVQNVASVYQPTEEEAEYEPQS